MITDFREAHARLGEKDRSHRDKRISLPEAAELVRETVRLRERERLNAAAV